MILTWGGEDILFWASGDCQHHITGHATTWKPEGFTFLNNQYVSNMMINIRTLFDISDDNNVSPTSLPTSM